MGCHHVAIATRDLDASHRFYTEAMGFALVKVETAPSPEGGRARHVFYDTGDGMLAVRELHGEHVGDFDPAISTGLAPPIWTNHIAFAAADSEALEAAKRRWLDQGHDVAEIDHDWCTSMCATDPAEIMAEWCSTTREFAAANHAEAVERLGAAEPPLLPQKSPVFHLADGRVVTD